MVKSKTPGYSPSTQGIFTATQVQFAQQDFVNKLQNLFFDSTRYQTGVSDYMMGRNPKLENPDTLLKREVCRVMLHLGSDTYLPTSQMQQLAGALLIENQSEFILGVIDEEQNFKEDWEVSRMGRQWKGWGGIEKETAKLWLDENKGVLCARFPYKEKVIDEIRAKIPKGKKSWNPDDKVWEFSVETIEVVVEILTDNFESLIDLTQAAPPTLTSSTAADPLLSLLDQDDINKIHKMLSKKYHPDVGGDSDKMARINQIFSKVK